MGLFNAIAEHLPVTSMFEAGIKVMDGELDEAAKILMKGLAGKELTNVAKEKLGGSSDGTDCNIPDD